MGTERDRRERVQGIPIWRRDNGVWQADFRNYTHGGRESLRTRNRTEAEEQLAERKRELEEAEEQDLETAPDPYLKDYFQRYLERRAKEIKQSTWDNEERALGLLTGWLQNAIGRKPRLSDVTLGRLRDFKSDQLDQVKASTFNVRLTGITQALQRAFEEGLVATNEAKRVRRPRVEKTEEVWLEIDEAVRVLEAAAEMETDPTSRSYPHVRALVATYLLTGGRRSEVLGLTRDSLDFEHGEVVIQSNEWRDLKNQHSARRVPLWPQLEAILRQHLEDLPADSELVFPSQWGGMISDLRASLSTLEDRAGLEKHLTPKVFRHTYTATRIQTLDHGAPVSPYTVARELGHTNINRIRDTYGHLQRRRLRLEEVRYE